VTLLKDNQAVESHNLLSSEGQLSKPTFSYRADVITAFSLGDELVHADGNDLLALQGVEKQLKHNPIGNGGTVSGLNSNPDIVISESRKFTGRSLVRFETPASRRVERRKRMKDEEHFLQKDWRFRGFMEQIKSSFPGADRDKLTDELWKVIPQGYYHSEVEAVGVRGRVLADYVALLDVENVDEEGAMEDLERVRRSWRPSHVVVGGGVDQSSGSLKCERSYGPSHVEDGGGDALLGSSSFQGDRNSPVQSERFRAREGRSQC
jgi:hypothetical protein